MTFETVEQVEAAKRAADAEFVKTLPRRHGVSRAFVGARVVRRSAEVEEYELIPPHLPNSPWR